MKRTWVGLALCVWSACGLPPHEGPGSKAEPTLAAPATLERRGLVRGRLQRRFPTQYRERAELFWEPTDTLPPEVLGKADPAALFAYFRSTAPVFPPAGIPTSCAVVGASGNLLGSGLGDEIDGHDVVLRINLAPTRGFETDVGRRTTHYLVTQWILGMVIDGKGHENVSPDLDGRLQSLADGAYWLLVYRPFDGPVAMEELLRQLPLLAERPHPIPRDRARLVHPEFSLLAGSWKIGLDEDPSTGLLGILFAAHACDSVDVYGFGPDARGQHSYYYKPSTHSDHGPNMEDVLIRRLDAARILRLRLARQ
jgi:hypothetical protein